MTGAVAVLSQTPLTTGIAHKLPAGPNAPTVFLSFHYSDADQVEDFIEQFGEAFASVRSVGVTAGDDFVHGCSDQEAITRIGSKYIGAAAVTIVLLGETTWTRRFVDWEIASSLALGRGLLTIDLPRALVGTRTLPPRLQHESSNHVLQYPYPDRVEDLQHWLAVSIARAHVSETPANAQRPLMRHDLANDDLSLTDASDRAAEHQQATF